VGVARAALRRGWAAVAFSSADREQRCWDLRAPGREAEASHDIPAARARAPRPPAPVLRDSTTVISWSYMHNALKPCWGSEPGLLKQRLPASGCMLCEREFQRVMAVCCAKVPHLPCRCVQRPTHKQNYCTKANTSRKGP